MSNVYILSSLSLSPTPIGLPWCTFHLKRERHDKAYGIRVVPNHERDLSHTDEMEVPPWLGPRRQGSASGGKKGSLVGAFELPLTPGVIIDVWACEGVVWATTPVAHVRVAVLERMYVVSAVEENLAEDAVPDSAGSGSVDDGDGLLAMVVRVDLFGRDPHEGRLVMESITATES